jgi:predicted secreted protein
MRRALAAVLALIPATAFAGDYAERTVIGFSPDAAYFAFVEYGVQDGSGFPYANAYVIDIASDRWLPGTPARVRIDDERATITAALGQAIDGVRPLLEHHAIATPPVVLTARPLTELTDPHEVGFLLRMPVPPSLDDSYILILTESVLPAANCPDMGEPFKGFTLDLLLPDNQARRLNHDVSIPASRRCPLGYHISEVLTDPARTVLVVLIDVMSVGFEGPDRRFMAVTTRLDP